MLNNLVNNIPDVVHVPNTSFIFDTFSAHKRRLFNGSFIDPTRAGVFLTELFSEQNIIFVEDDEEIEITYTLFKDIGLTGGSTLNDGTIVVKYDRYQFGYTFIDDSLFYELIAACDRIISHEMIHRMQLDLLVEDDTKHLMMDLSSAQTYLGNPYEIMAFAYQSVVEFKQNGFSNDTIITLLESDDLINSQMCDFSDAMIDYMSTFEQTDDVFQLFLNYINIFISLN